MAAQTTKPIMDELIKTRTEQFESMLVTTRQRGRADKADAFRAGMRQMLTDLVNMNLIEYVMLPENNNVDRS